MRKSGYFFSIAFVPSVSLAAYWSMFFAVIADCGFSPANGSGRRLAGLVAGPALACSRRVQAGMLPSLLPALSAPKGVSSAFSRSASASDTAAPAPWLAMIKTRNGKTCFGFIVGPSNDRSDLETLADD